MAVYWVDPYIEASVGGIHGTTDTTSRSGTYAAPWALSDMYATAYGGNTNLSGLSNGDEIRFKGLSLTSYLIDAGSDWYPSGNHIYKATALNSATTTAISSWGNTGLVAMYDTTATDKFTCADSDGNKPLVFVPVYVNSTSSPSNQFSAIQGPQTIMNIGPLRAEGTSSSNAALQMYLVDPQYYIPNSQTGNQYFCQYTSIGIKVTDGWTSSTARDGYTVLPIFRASSTSSLSVYYNTNSSLASGPDTLYDLPSTYFVYQNNAGSSYTYGHHFICSATNGYHSGNAYTQRFGGFVANGSSSASLYDYTGNYYWSGTGGGAYSASGTNNCEIKISMFHYYGIRSYVSYGSSTASEYTTKRYNNNFTYYYIYTLQSANRAANYYIGTSMCYYVFDRYLIYASSSTYSTPLYFLSGAYFYKYGFYNGGLFSPTGITFDFTFLGTIYNYDGPALSDRQPYSGEGPQYLYEAATTAPYLSTPKLNPSSWTDGISAVYLITRATKAYNTSTISSLGVLDVGTSDYTTGSCKFLVGTNINLYRYNETNGDTYQTNVIVHTNSNTSDGLPIGMALSTEKTELLHPPMLYYNDADKSGALCFVSNDQAENIAYQQSIEIPITATAAYSSSDTIRLKARLETSSNWSSTSYAIGAWYLNTSNEPTFQVIQSASAAITTATDYTYDLAASSLYDAGNNYRFLRFVIYVTNNNTVSQKLWVHELSATVV